MVGKGDGKSSSSTSGTIKLLDLCSGCGVQGIVCSSNLANSSSSATELTMVEINPRAVRFCRFNTLLNHCEGRVKIVQGDVRRLVV